MEDLMESTGFTNALRGGALEGIIDKVKVSLTK